MSFEVAMQTPNLVPERDHFEFVHQEWPADPAQLRSVRRHIQNWLAPLELSEQARHDLLLAVNEAVTNAVEHAYGPGAPEETVEVYFWIDAHGVFFEVVDHGRWKTPASSPTGRGLGIPLIHRLVDSVIIHYGAEGTRVLMRQNLPAGSSSGSRFSLP